jgi:transglutaminase-like putative cysteine protease
VDLFANLSGQLRQDEVVDLVKVRTDDPNPYYLRFGVADRLTSQGFAVRAPVGQPASRQLPTGVPARSGVTQRRYRATVEVPELNQNLLPVFLQPLRANLDGVDANWYYDDRLQVVYSRRASAKGKEYSFDYVHLDFSPAALGTAQPLAASSTIQQQFTQVQPVQEIEDRVAELTEGEESVYDKVMAIFNFFSRDNGFTYSLETESGTSGSAIVDFLINKRGFCEQYAAAMAWLVRAAGIPARVAFGFTRGTETDGDFTVLTTKNLHAWTEVYFSGFGWVPFDATPAASVPGAADPIWARSPDAPPLSTIPGAAAPGGPTTAPGQIDPNDPEARDPDQGLSPGGTPIEPNGSNWGWWTLAIGVVVLALLGLPAMRRSLLRRRRQSGPASPAAATVGPDLTVVDPRSGERQILVIGDTAAAARADANAAWAELLDTLVDYRLAVDATETPRATAERLVRTERLEQPAAEGVRLLGRAEERARYARDPLNSDPLVRALRTVRRAIRQDASLGTRIVAVLMPPSVVERWRLAAVELSSRAVTVVNRWAETLSPRRLLPRRG